MNPFDDLIKSAGLTYEELTPDEKETYQKQMLQVRNLSIDDIAKVLTKLRYAVELQLVDTPDSEDHRDANSKLKARLKNYMVLEMFMLDPKIRLDEMREQLSKVKASQAIA